MNLPIRQLRTSLLALAVAAVLLAASGAWSTPARAAVCGGEVAYPGDTAESVDFANWMANGAFRAKLPSELPVMAALVESGLRNLNYGDADSVGFFQMRTSIWNKGIYKGYLKNPELQLQWFLTTAADVRASYIKNGKGDPALSSATYGVWIADIERPAAQYRGRYQPRLKDAQALIGQSCGNLVGVNVLAPMSSLRLTRRQHPARSGRISASVRCPKDACLASMSVTFRLPGRRKPVKLASDTTMLAPGHRARVKVTVPRSIRSKIRRQLPGRSTTRARVRISVAGTNGAATVRVRKILLAR